MDCAIVQESRRKCRRTRVPLAGLGIVLVVGDDCVGDFRDEFSDPRGFVWLQSVGIRSEKPLVPRRLLLGAVLVRQYVFHSNDSEQTELNNILAHDVCKRRQVFGTNYHLGREGIITNMMIRIVTYIF